MYQDDMSKEPCACMHHACNHLGLQHAVTVTFNCVQSVHVNCVSVNCSCVSCRQRRGEHLRKRCKANSSSKICDFCYNRGIVTGLEVFMCPYSNIGIK